MDISKLDLKFFKAVKKILNGEPVNHLPLFNVNSNLQGSLLEYAAESENRILQGQTPQQAYQREGIKYLYSENFRQQSIKSLQFLVDKYVK